VSYFGTSHLGTPEVAFEKSGEVTWRAQAQAFGETQITLNAIDNALRFPGQYFDRDYDPRLGRYVQSDPIRLNGGLNRYAYVIGNPIFRSDPYGLKTIQCTKPLNALEEKIGPDGAKIAHDWVPYLYHQYSCVVGKDGKVTCGGQDAAGRPLYGPGKPSQDSLEAGRKV